MTAQQGTGFVGISNHLKTSLIPSLTTIRATNIFDYEVTDLGGYPAVTITATDLLGKFLDNARNQRTYKFSIKVFIDRNQAGFGLNQSEQILRAVADEIIQKVDADVTLNGNCIYAMPVNVKFGYIERQNHNIRLAEIVLNCIDAITYKT